MFGHVLILVLSGSFTATTPVGRYAAYTHKAWLHFGLVQSEESRVDLGDFNETAGDVCAGFKRLRLPLTSFRTERRRGGLTGVTQSVRALYDLLIVCSITI